jgi:hypothetical protein
VDIPCAKDQVPGVYRRGKRYRGRPREDFSVEELAGAENSQRDSILSRVPQFLSSFYKELWKDSKTLVVKLTRKNDEACQKAFRELKNRLPSAPILIHYRPNPATKLEPDSSDGVVGAVLSQLYEEGNQWHPVAFFSKTIAPAECNHGIRDKKMLAIIRALQEYRAELEGLRREDRFDIFTDHRALGYFTTTKALNSRQANWAEYLSRFHFMIRYRPGTSNTLADALKPARRRRAAAERGEKEGSRADPVAG